MKKFILAALALIATAGAASAQFESTFGSIGNFNLGGFTGGATAPSIGFGGSNCSSGGQGLGGFGNTACESGAQGTFHQAGVETIAGALTDVQFTNGLTGTNSTGGVLSQWFKNSSGVSGVSQVGNSTNTNSITQVQGFRGISGEIYQSSGSVFDGNGFSHTTSDFTAGMAAMMAAMNPNPD